MDWIRTGRQIMGVGGVLAFAALASVADANNGTKLSVVAEADAPVCSADATQATVNIVTAVTSSGSAAAAAVLVSTDGGMTFTNVGTVTTAEWSGNGRTKTAEETVQVSLVADVSTPVTICFVQPGANGNEFKKACSDLTLTPSCAPVQLPNGEPCMDNAQCASNNCLHLCAVDPHVCALQGVGCTASE